MKISNEDLALIRKMEEIGRHGYYVDSVQLTDLYNRVLEKKVNPTNCGACLKTRLNELVEAADKFERMIQLEKKEEPAEEPKEETINEVSSANSVCTKKPKAKK